jgi:hypothetical protein
LAAQLKPQREDATIRTLNNNHNASKEIGSVVVQVFVNKSGLGATLIKVGFHSAIF